MTDEFGWSRRNAFIQPQVDAVMLEGLSRFPNVRACSPASWRPSANKTAK